MLKTHVIMCYIVSCLSNEHMSMGKRMAYQWGQLKPFMN
jgi:hypothetical protein